jgi:hypothetical protein
MPQNDRKLPASPPAGFDPDIAADAHYFVATLIVQSMDNGGAEGEKPGVEAVLHAIAFQHHIMVERLRRDGCCVNCGRVLGRARFTCCQPCKFSQAGHTDTCDRRQP